MSNILDERDFAHVGDKTATIRADDAAASSAFRPMYETLPNVVSAEDMPWEKSADGLIKHLVHHKMNTRERCVEAYMQFLKPGERSGKPRHMWEGGRLWVRGRATTFTGTSSSTASTPSNGNGTRSRRSTSGSAAISSMCRRSRST